MRWADRKALAILHSLLGKTLWNCEDREAEGGLVCSTTRGWWITCKAAHLAIELVLAVSWELAGASDPLQMSLSTAHSDSLTAWQLTPQIEDGHAWLFYYLASEVMWCHLSYPLLVEIVRKLCPGSRKKGSEKVLEEHMGWEMLLHLLQKMPQVIAIQGQVMAGDLGMQPTKASLLGLDSVAEWHPLSGDSWQEQGQAWEFISRWYNGVIKSRFSSQIPCIWILDFPVSSLGSRARNLTPLCLSFPMDWDNDSTYLTGLLRGFSQLI